MSDDTFPSLAGWGALVVIGIGFWRAERRPLGAVAAGFGVLGLATAAFAELIPAAVFLGTGALGIGLLFGIRRSLA